MRPPQPMEPLLPPGVLGLEAADHAGRRRPWHWGRTHDVAKDKSPQPMGHPPIGTPDPAQPPQAMELGSNTRIGAKFAPDPVGFGPSLVDGGTALFNPGREFVKSGPRWSEPAQMRMESAQASSVPGQQ